MSLWDSSGFGEVYAAEGCFAVRYENGVVVEHIGPFDTEQKSENCRFRWRRGELNAKDKRLLKPGDVRPE